MVLRAYVEGKGTKSRFLGLSERFGDYILQSKVVVGDIWRIYSEFSGNIWLKKEVFWPILWSFYVMFMG